MNNDWREYTGDQDYLEHHGILGQKWGVRRFENKNGHLTPAGLKRYEDGRKVTEKEKHAFSAKAAGYKALGALHTVNAKAPINTKAGRTLAKAAAKEANKAADKAQKEAGAKKAEKEANKKTLTPEQKKKILIAGAAVVGTAVAAYGGYKLYQLNKANSGDMLNAQKKDVKKVYTKYAKDRSAWEKKTIDRESYKRLAEKAGNTALANKIDKKLASSPPPLPPSASKKGMAATNKLASEASALAKSVTAEGPKSFSKPAQNSSQTRSQSIPNKVKIETTRQTYDLSKSKPQQTVNTGRKTVTNTTKIHGQEKFNAASKANDDLVQELLKKNTIKF